MLQRKDKADQGKRYRGVTLKIVIREDFPEEVTFETQGSERAWGHFGKSVPEGENSSSKALGQDCALCVGGTVRRPVRWNEMSEGRGMK